MHNLAGHPEATALFRAELAAAGLDVAEVPPYGEPQCTIVGTLALPGGFALRVRRAWAYQCVAIDPPLPVDLARRVNNAPCVLEGGSYSGEPGTLGAVARANGDSGGRASGDITRPVETWNVDDVDALAALVAELRRALDAVGPGDVGDAARRADRAQWTSDMLAEIDPWPRTNSSWRLCVEGLLKSPRTDWSNPGVYLLRAELKRRRKGALRLAEACW